METFNSLLVVTARLLGNAFYSKVGGWIFPLSPNKLHVPPVFGAIAGLPYHISP